MDLSRLKWPVIIAVVVGGIWLLSSPGVNFLHKKFMEPAADAEAAASNEANLSRLGQYLFKTLRYNKAAEIFEDSMELYPNGKNYYYCYYRLIKCREKQGRYSDASAIIVDLMDINAHNIDDRVPDNDVLRLRLDKLLETHELGETGQF